MATKDRSYWSYLGDEFRRQPHLPGNPAEELGKTLLIGAITLGSVGLSAFGTIEFMNTHKPEFLALDAPAAILVGAGIFEVGNIFANAHYNWRRNKQITLPR